MKRNTKHAFSLIELIVVIAVITILMLLIFPVLGRARSSARTVRGLANVRQWVLAFTMYADDHRGRFPTEGQAGGGIDWNDSEAWFNALPPLVGEIQLRHAPNPPSHPEHPGFGRYPRPGDNNIFMCPNLRASDLHAPVPANAPIFTYAYNLWIEHDDEPPVRLQQVEHFASRLAIIGERGPTDDNPTSSGFANMDDQHVAFRHRAGRETLMGFADGHARALTQDDLDTVIWNPRDR